MLQFPGAIKQGWCCTLTKLQTLGFAIQLPVLLLGRNACMHACNIALMQQSHYLKTDVCISSLCNLVMAMRT